MQDELEKEALEMKAPERATGKAATTPGPSPTNGQNGQNFKPTWKAGEIIEMDPRRVRLIEDPKDPLFDVRVLGEADPNLVADIKEDGFESVVWIVEREPGVADLVAGRKRVKAARETDEMVNCLVLDPELDSYQLVRRMIVENERRHQDTVINRARKAKLMLELGLERLRPKAEGVKQDEESGEIEYTGDAWRPTAKQRREILEEVARAFGVTRKRIQDQLLPLVEDLSPKVQKALEKGQIAEAVALQWKEKSHEQQEKALERALEKAAGEKIKGKGQTRKPGGDYPKLQFKRPELELARENLREGTASAPKAVTEFLDAYLGYIELGAAPRWIQKLFDWEPEEEKEADE